MRRQLLPALRMVLVMTVLTGLAYPLLMTGVAQVFFGAKADGSLVRVDGRVVGSALVGQEFTSPRYFHGRPSAAGPGASGSKVDGAAVDTSDLANDSSSASNLGPTNPELISTVAHRVRAYREENGLAADAEVPVDAVTASGSGLDPHISVANARIQARRVAGERGLPLDTVLGLVDDHTDGRSLGFLGEPGVNVLEVNLALDRASWPGRGASPASSSPWPGSRRSSPPPRWCRCEARSSPRSRCSCSR
jgi:potassium-transporting ATPase KdpC subunit